jgi:uncharacterized protein YacL
MSWLTLDAFYDYLLGNVSEDAIKKFLRDYEDQIKKFETLLAIPKKYDILVHTASVIFALLIENMSKEISYLRATIFYMAIYSYITSFIINKVVKDVAHLMQQLIEHAKSLQS